MKILEKEKMGRFKVELELANNDEVAAAKLGQFDPAKIRRVTIQAVVDSGATRLVLPSAVAKQLGLTPAEKVRVYVMPMADPPT